MTKTVILGRCKKYNNSFLIGQEYQFEIPIYSNSILVHHVGGMCYYNSIWEFFENWEILKQVEVEVAPNPEPIKFL